ncbi:hypothetical protein [Streptococcus porcinus]
MTKKSKIIFGIIVSIISIIVVTIFSLESIFGTKAYFYGRASKENTINKLFSEDGRSKGPYKLEKLKAKTGDIVKVTFTDAGGVILDEQIVSSEEVPKSVKKVVVND